IADRLGFTKAALYYHFKSKDEILRALLAPADQLMREFLERLEDADGIEGWADALAWIIGSMVDYIDFFKLVERNRTAIDSLGDALEAFRDHDQMHKRIEAAVRSKTDDLVEQVRMVAALAAVAGFDDFAPELLTTTDPKLIEAELTAAVR